MTAGAVRVRYLAAATCWDGRASRFPFARRPVCRNVCTSRSSSTAKVPSVLSNAALSPYTYSLLVCQFQGVGSKAQRKC